MSSALSTAIFMSSALSTAIFMSGSLLAAYISPVLFDLCFTSWFACSASDVC